MAHKTTEMYQSVGAYAWVGKSSKRILLEKGLSVSEKYIGGYMYAVKRLLSLICAFFHFIFYDLFIASMTVRDIEAHSILMCSLFTHQLTLSLANR